MPKAGLAMTMETIWTTVKTTQTYRNMFSSFMSVCILVATGTKMITFVYPGTSPQLKKPTFLELILSYTHAKIIIGIP